MNLNTEIYEYGELALTTWLKHCGSEIPDYFKALNGGGLKLQQVPEEYASLLLLLKSRDIKRYLALGLGNGGSFLTECFFMQRTLQSATGVDSMSIKEAAWQSEALIRTRFKQVNQFCPNVDLKFAMMTTDDFFFVTHDSTLFDCIFIDAGHKYEEARNDFDNSLKHIAKGGMIVFHDIASELCPGVQKLWQEVKQGRRNVEFIASQTCGIGVVFIEP